MQFLPAAQGPIILEVGDEKIAVPRFEMSDFILWAADIDQEKVKRFDASAADVQDEEKRFHLRNTYSVIPADIAECLRLVYTPAGIKRVCDACFARAKIIERGGQPADESLPPEKAAGILSANIGEQPRLARILVGTADVPRPAGAATDSGGKQDPLTASGKAS